MTYSIDWAGFHFDNNKACIVCSHALEGRSISFVAHHSDGDLQFLCDKDTHSAEEALAVGLEHILELHPELKTISFLPFGHMAARSNGTWMVSSLEDDD